MLYNSSLQVAMPNDSFQMVNAHSKTNKYVRRYQFGSVFLDRAAA